ncbi:MAG: fumarylacetoacetate hydrolase family protein [Caldimicrobium sp.]
MKIGRFRERERERIFYGLVWEDKVIDLTSEERRAYPLQDLKILPPVVPTKIVAVGLNYRDHAEELNMPIPQEPILFLKPPSAIVGPEDFIILPPESKEVHYEGELAIVIGKEIYRPKKYQEVEEAILGYTCFNDVTARDLQRKDGQWTRSKSFNTFAPIGPFIVKDIDPEGLTIQTRVNGKVVQNSKTSALIFKPLELVYFISQIMSLYPGDVIATGTPPGVGLLHPGDVVEIEIENVGILRNYVQALE